jgi:hypothetical protein
MLLEVIGGVMSGGKVDDGESLLPQHDQPHLAGTRPDCRYQILAVTFQTSIYCPALLLVGYLGTA